MCHFFLLLPRISRHIICAQIDIVRRNKLDFLVQSNKIFIRQNVLHRSPSDVFIYFIVLISLYKYTKP